MKYFILSTYILCFFSTVACSQEKQIAAPDTTKMYFMAETTVQYTNGQKYYLKGSNKPYTGFLYAKYDNGELLSVQQFVEGVGHGIWINYDPEGRKECQGTYINNRVEGPVTFFYEDGSIKSKGQYRDWKRPIGVWTYYDRQGNVISTMNYTR